MELWVNKQREKGGEREEVAHGSDWHFHLYLMPWPAEGNLVKG